MTRLAGRHRDKLADERATAEAMLADLLQRELALEAGQTAVMEQAERKLPAFTKAIQSVAMVATLLDTLPVLSTNRVCEMYQHLKSILGITTAQQA
jgi:hypothetical protein